MIDNESQCTRSQYGVLVCIVAGTPNPLDDLTQTTVRGVTCTPMQTVVECKTQSLLNLTRPDHLVSYSTVQDLIILNLTQSYVQDPIILSLIILNVTKPNHLVYYHTRPYHLVSYSIIQEPTILSLILSNTRPSHLVSYSTLQDSIILFLDQHANVDKMHMHIGTEYLHFAAQNPVIV